MLQTIGPRLLVSALALSILASSQAVAQKPGKGGGGGTTLPPVRYQVQFWSGPGVAGSLAISDSNDSGQVVGAIQIDLDGDGIGDTYHGYLYDPGVDVEFAVDLNTIVSNLPEGWVIRKAMAINEVGQIAAYLAPSSAGIGSPDLVQAAVVDLNANPPVVDVVPDAALTQYSIALDINDRGDLTASYRRDDGTWGHYAYNFDPESGILEPQDLGVTTSGQSTVLINNSRHIVGQKEGWRSYRLAWNGGIEEFAGTSVTSLNNGGAFGGLAIVGKQKTLKAFLQTTTFESFDSGGRQVQDLNDSLDFLVSDSLYHRNLGKLSVITMLDSTDPDSALLLSGPSFFPLRLSNRDFVTGFPSLTGTAGGMGVTLTPVPAP